MGVEYFNNMNVGNKCFGNVLENRKYKIFKEVQDCKYSYFDRRGYDYEKWKAHSKYFQS